MAADSTCSLKFGPEWIRVLSDSSAGQAPQAQASQATPPRKYPLAKHRYGKEELIAIYEQTLYGDTVPPLSTPGFVFCDGVYIEQSQTPRSLIPMTDEEQRLWAFQRVASSRGRGRGITPAPWAAARSVGGHLQQTRNWRSPEKPISSTTQMPTSNPSQFNYWRKNSLNEDEKVPEWADEKVSDDNDNVGSFDEKGGFLSLESRGRTTENASANSSTGNSFPQRPVASADGEAHLARPTVESSIESNVCRTLMDKLSCSSPLQSAKERDSSHPQNIREKEEPLDIPTSKSIPGGPAVIQIPTVPLAEDARVCTNQSKRAQVVILGDGSVSVDSITVAAPTADQDSAPTVPSDGSLQQSARWSHANRDIAEAPLWYYKDPQGIIQGPFSSTDMLEWSTQGYFHDSLECRRACDSVFNPLGALKKVWNGRLPFVMPNLHGPIANVILPTVSTSRQNAVFNVSSVPMGLGVNSLCAVGAMNGFVAAGGASSSVVSSVSPMRALTSALHPENAYVDEANSQFNALSQRQNDFDGRSQHMANENGIDSSLIGVGHNPALGRAQQLESGSSLPENMLETPIRRSHHEDQFNQSVNNHVTADSGTGGNHRRAVISNRLIEHVTSAAPPLRARSTAALNTLEQRTDPTSSSWFSRSATSSNLGYPQETEAIPPSADSGVDRAFGASTAHHHAIAQHELPNSWLVQRKNERNAEGNQMAPAHLDEPEQVVLNKSSWNDFEYSYDISRMNPSADGDVGPAQSRNPRQQDEALLQAQNSDLEHQDNHGLYQETPEGAPFEKVAEKKKKRDRREKQQQQDDRLVRERREPADDQKKHLVQQDSSDEDADWDSGEQIAASKMASYQDVIIPAPAPAIPAWGNTSEKNMSALSLQEIQRLEEERADRERQQRQQEALKNGYYSGIKTWANAIAPIKSFDQIQKEQQASKSSATQNKHQSKGAPASYTPLSAADVVANGIGCTPTHKSSSSKATLKMSSVVKGNVAITRPSATAASNHNNNNSPTGNHNHHHTINNNGGEKSVLATETTNNEQQLIDWCAQITKGLNSYLDMPTVVSILKDVESEAEIEDYVSQFFGETLREPRQFARQFVQKRAKFNVGLASSLPKQSEWCTTGGNKKRKGAKK
ncbi:GRB10-interacting GYF protein 2 [Galendromus occidentalis]|uniref:GRB10-interacting GYF protein 2 n=1 Tax=Galendromus occidentalis TaxID=34638 RepID=A0AAJ6QVK7_9ACAR|nr:GRB10-interacting GYF protein 2 [Galendromus occidentalis]